MPNKYYLLYDSREQKKLLTTASSIEILNEESSFYSEGFWFEYDLKENSNLLENEVEMENVVFPKKPKERVKKAWLTEKNWLGK